MFRTAKNFDRFRPFLQKLPKEHRFAVDSHKQWLDEKFTDVLRENGVALAID